MADYTAKITFLVPITAGTEEKAHERASELAEVIQSGKWPTFKKPWLNGDMETETEVEEA